MKHAMKVTTNETGAERSRIIIEVNGYEVEVLADQDGVGVSLTQIKDGLLVDDCGTDWLDDEETGGYCGTGCGCSRAA